MSREGRNQPIQPFSSHGFLGNVPANGVLPGQILVVDAPATDDRQRKTPPLQPIVQHGFVANVPFVPPPEPFSLDRLDQRVRYRPLDAILLSGALAPQAPTVIVPPVPVVVPLDERGRFRPSSRPGVPGYEIFDLSQDPAVYPPEPVVAEPARPRVLPLTPVALNGLLALTTAPAAAPPAPTVSPAHERPRATGPLQAFAEHAFVDPGPAAVGDTPPLPTSIDRNDQRTRWLPLPSTVLNGLAASVQPPAPGPPPPPFFVPLNERRRTTTDPLSLSGVLASFLLFTAPPASQSVEPSRRPTRVPDPVVLNGILAALGLPVVAPPAPVVAEPARRKPQVLDPVVLGGSQLARFFPPVTVPPPPVVIIGDDGRRRLYPQPILLSGARLTPGLLGAIITSRFNTDPSGESRTDPSAGGFDNPVPVGGSSSSPDTGAFDTPNPHLN
jgi:hypothetical protein